MVRIHNIWARVETAASVLFEGFLQTKLALVECVNLFIFMVANVILGMIFVVLIMYFCCDYQVEELQKQNSLSREEFEQVEFIQTIESLCSTPATRCSSRLDTGR